MCSGCHFRWAKWNSFALVQFTGQSDVQILIDVIDFADRRRRCNGRHQKSLLQAFEWVFIIILLLLFHGWLFLEHIPFYFVLFGHRASIGSRNFVTHVWFVLKQAWHTFNLILRSEHTRVPALPLLCPIFTAHFQLIILKRNTHVLGDTIRRTEILNVRMHLVAVRGISRTIWLSSIWGHFLRRKVYFYRTTRLMHFLLFLFIWLSPHKLKIKY